MNNFDLICGDASTILWTLPEKSVQTIVTSPPYWGLRDYGEEGQLGSEPTPDEFVNNLVSVFAEARNVLKDDGVLWLNLGDSYYNYRPGKGQKQIEQFGSGKGTEVSNCPRRGTKIEGLKEKDLVGIPWRVALALQADGWYLRQDIIWHKPNPMPESVRDRCTKAHEYIFMLTKDKRYYFDNKAIREPSIWAGKDKRSVTGPSSSGKAATGKYAINKSGAYSKDGKRNKRSVWAVNTKPFKGAHFAVFPLELIEPCVLSSSREDDTVLDPFNGSGTTGVCALNNNRNYVGIDLNQKYIDISTNRINQEVKPDE